MAKISYKAEKHTFSGGDRSDASDYPIDIKYEPLAIKQEPAEIAESEEGCVQVDNMFIVQPKVEFHIKREEIGVRWRPVVRKCDICEDCFTNGLDLVAHRYAHTEDTYYTCCICNCNTFQLKPDLHRHMLNVHFNLTSKLPISAKLNAIERSNNSEKKYQCDLCAKRFLYISLLNRHTRVHTGEKPYECNVCRQSFNQNQHLTRHKRIHTDAKPYECDICHKCFNQKGYLAIHLRIHRGMRIHHS